MEDVLKDWVLNSVLIRKINIKLAIQRKETQDTGRKLGDISCVTIQKSPSSV